MNIVRQKWNGSLSVVIKHVKPSQQWDQLSALLREIRPQLQASPETFNFIQYFNIF